MGASKLKMIVVGDSQCGKSSLLQQFVHGRFEPAREMTVGVDLAFKTMAFRNRSVRMQLWDLAGQSTFHNIIRVYYRGAHVILFVYDVTDERSFEHVRHWLDRIQCAWSNDYSPVMMLVGNKTDREGRDRVVTREAGEAFARRHGMMFCETSAKTGEGVEDAFLLAAHMFVKSHASVLEDAETGVELVTPDGAEGLGTMSGCCW
jgi:small GTP-binding protein